LTVRQVKSHLEMDLGVASLPLARAVLPPHIGGKWIGGGRDKPIPIPLDAFPVLIPLDDPLTENVEETDISFFISGISSLQFEVVQDGVWITSITPIPEPCTLLLLGLIDVNYFSRSATIIIPGSPLPPKPAPYPMRVKRREPVGRP
jgi:hypothetical protein